MKAIKKATESNDRQKKEPLETKAFADVNDTNVVKLSKGNQSNNRDESILSIALAANTLAECLMKINHGIVIEVIDIIEELAPLMISDKDAYDVINHAKSKGEA